jgi:hypothetical protein
VSDKDYKKWKKKHGYDLVPEWIATILRESKPTNEFCWEAYNNKGDVR